MKFFKEKQLNISDGQLLRRGISGILAAAMMFQGAVISTPLKVEAAGASSASWSNHGPVVVDGVNLEMSKKLTALGGGQYELAFTTSGTTTVTYKSENSRATNEGIYIVCKTGTYQIDLYGGDGGNGKGNGTVSACTGGAGGHVHGQVYLQAGQVLYYSIGGNGTTTSAGGLGGGANEGGNNSGTGNSTGGGGGYSAVYLLDTSHAQTTKAENRTFLTQEEIDDIKTQTYNPENFPADSYLMIAGGGGGGGALSFLAQNPANGGSGGTLDSASYGAANGVVSGTWYGGTDGTSSGSGNTGSAGGNISTSWTADRKGGDSENRGGAGGAGFGGGGNGSSTQLLGTNVGGGGGGSSFVADTVNTNVQPIGKDDSIYGGSISITDAASRSESYGVSFSATISKYFDVAFKTGTGVLTSNADGTTTVNASTEISLEEKVLVLSLTARYGAAFGGGNNVPIFAQAARVAVGDQSVCFDNTADDLFDTNDKDDPNDQVTDYVNVPLSYSVKTQSISDGTHTSKTVRDLYDYEIGDPAAPANPYTTNEFVSGLSYEVYVNGTDMTKPENILGADTVLDEKTYVVGLTVTPRATAGDGGTGVAAVGAEVTRKTFYAVALVTTNTPTDLNTTFGENGEIGVAITKNLSYADGKYTLAVNVAGSASDTVGYKDIYGDGGLPAVKYAYDKTANEAGGYTYTVPIDGYYFIQAWGGDGGNGGDSGNKKGGIGGYGAYLEGYIYLTKDTELEIVCGSAGDSEDKVEEKNALAGTGGAPTTVTIADATGAPANPLLVAAGGGGGGGAQSKYGIFGLQGNDKDGLGREQTRTDLTGKYTGMLVNGVIYYATKFDHESTDATISGQVVNQRRTGDSGIITTYAADTIANAKGGDGNPGTGSNSNAWAGNAGVSYIDTGRINLAVSDLTSEAESLIAERNFRDARENYSFSDSDNKITDFDPNPGAVHITCVQAANSARYEVDEEAIAKMAETLSELIRKATVTVDFSKYFDVSETGLTVEEAYLTVAGGVLSEKSGLSATRDANDPRTITVTTDKTQSYADYSAVDDAEKAHTTRVTVAANYTVYFTFGPEAGFLGGNDVPLVESATVTLAGKEQEIGSDDAADYANVAITGLDLITLTPMNPEQHVVSGETITTPLYTYSKENPDADWQADYVEFVNASISPEVVTKPTETIQYTITAGIEPRIKEAEKAVAAGSVSGVYKSIVNTVYVDYSVTVNAANASAVGFPGRVAEGEGINGQITADEGHVLPQSISVSGVTGYTYDRATGQITISAGEITGNVTIGVNAQPVPCHVKFIIVKADGSEEIYLEKTVDYGKDIGSDIAAANKYAADQENYLDGHTFGWVDMPELDDEGHYYLKTGNLTVYGGYVPNVHSVTINYVDTEGDQIFTSYAAQYYYGTEYSVTSPVKAGYTPYIIESETVKHFAKVVEGTMGDADENIEVTYVPNEYTLTVKYVYENGTTASEAETKTVTYGTDYSVKSPVITGYTPDQETVSGTMDAEGKTVTVTYIPNKYTLTVKYVYEKDGSEAKPTVEKLVPYGTEYNVKSPDIESYLADTAVVSGTMPAEDVEVTVTYKDIPAGLTVRFFYADGTPVLDSEGNPSVLYKEGKQAEQITFSYENGDFPNVKGHTPTPATATKDKNVESKVVDVIYYPNHYTLTVKYVDKDGNPINDVNGDPIVDHTEDVPYGTTYSVESPAVIGYTPYVIVSDTERVEAETVTGIMDAEDEEITITYIPNEHTVTFHYYVYGDNESVKSESWQFVFGSDLTIGVPAQLVVGDEVLTGYEPRENKGDEDIWESIKVATDQDKDIEYNIYYYPKRYTLAIIGIDPFGNIWTENGDVLLSKIEKVEHGVAKTVTLPTLEGYTAVNQNGQTISSVTGSWTAENAVEYVTYVKDDVAYYVTVDWGNLVFDYTQRTNWNGGTHQYYIPPENPGTNYVKVNNRRLSQKDVLVDVAFAPNGDYPTMNGLFTIGDSTAKNAAVTDNRVNKGITQTYWLWMYGSLTSTQENARINNVGDCIVTIKPAD